MKSIKDRGVVIFDKPAFWKSVDLRIRSAYVHTRGEIQPRCFIWTTQNLHFPVAHDCPFKVVEPIFEKVLHDAEIRLIVWSRGRRGLLDS